MSISPLFQKLGFSLSLHEAYLGFISELEVYIPIFKTNLSICTLISLPPMALNVQIQPQYSRYYGTLPRSFLGWKHSLPKFWQYWLQHAHSCLSLGTVLATGNIWLICIYKGPGVILTRCGMTLKAVMVNSKPVRFQNSL